MSEFKPSPYQVAIKRTYQHEDCNMLVGAVAGSGKTTTLLDLMNVATGKITFLAFNKSIVNELSERVPHSVDVMTMHSMGMKAIMRKHGKVNVNAYKTGKFIKQNLETEGFWEVPKKGKEQLFMILPRLVDIYRLTLCENMEELRLVADNIGIEYKANHLGFAMDIIRQLEKYNKNPKEIDFTDMVYLPATGDGYSFPKSDVWFIDECQDLSPCQHLLFKRAKKRSRFVAVGDPYQCQPKGTMISMCDGSKKPIEEVVVGDRVVGYNAHKKGGFVGYLSNKHLVDKYSKDAPEVLEISSREYDQSLVCVNVDGNISKYTPNHKCIVKYRDVEKHILYLMQKNGKFRIGVFPYYSENGFGLSIRSRQEKADRSWILDVFDTKREAFLEEQFLSYEYGIPQLRFVDNKSGIMTQEELDCLWGKFGDTTNLQRSTSLLLRFGKHPDNPLWMKGRNVHHSRHGICEVNASNLDPRIMTLIKFNKENKVPNKPIKADYCTFDMWPEAYFGKVYSLKISKGEKYIADNILTHNSIYGFAGADSNSFSRFLDYPNTKEMPLSICYRCPQKVAMHANKVYDVVEYPDWKEMGEVRNGEVSEASGTDMIICRNIKPLIAAFFVLIAEGKKCYIKGKDIGEALIRLVKPYKDRDTEGLLMCLQQDLQEMEGELIEKGVTNPRKHPRWINLEEKIAAIRIILHTYNTPQKLLSALETMFGDEGTGIVLSSIHKSKGLEADNVFLLNSHLIPSQYASTEEQLKQENNLLYVAITRAKKKLIYCYIII